MGGSNTTTGLLLNPLTMGTTLIGGLGYNQYKKDKEAERAARTLADQQKDELKRQQDEYKKRLDQEANSSASIAIRNQMRFRSRANAPYNRSGTILTSPLGIPNQSSGGLKTLLGG